MLFIGRDQKNGGLAEYFGSICYPRERVLGSHGHLSEKSNIYKLCIEILFFFIVIMLYNEKVESKVCVHGVTNWSETFG